MQMTFRFAAAAAACTALLAGCGSGGYYMVRDPGSAAPPYYTTSISTSGSALVFKDAKNGNAVTLQNTEVKRISKEEFAQGMAAGAGATSPAVVVVPAAPPPAKPQ
jgi:hypothetical protein